MNRNASRCSQAIQLPVMEMGVSKLREIFKVSKMTI
jgi:hypothetical protein